MAPTRSSVASVAQAVRADNPNHRSVTAPSASDNVSTHSPLPDIGHGQDKLSKVPSPAPPSLEPPVAAPSPPQPRTPGRGRSHVFASVERVPFQIDAVATIETIQKMRTSAWGLRRQWPLDGLFRWLDGGKETGLEEPALDAEPVPALNAEPVPALDAKPVPAMDGETFTDKPPPYSLT